MLSDRMATMLAKNVGIFVIFNLYVVRIFSNQGDHLSENLEMSENLRALREMLGN